MSTKEKVKGIFLSTGLLAAIASSLCCIAPLVAILGGASGAASSFSWIEPVRPYLIVVSALALGFAFYQAYKAKPEDDCGCDPNKKKSFLNSKGFLWGITILSIVMFLFPNYSYVFYNSNSSTPISVNDSALNYTFEIDGMTCSGCENHIESSVNTINGVFGLDAKYDEGIATLNIDTTQASLDQIQETIQSEAGYKVTNYKLNP